MTTTENSGARDEYFVQISELCGKYFRTESFTLKRKCKDKVLEISYDTNVALQKRVEELEAHLRWTLRVMKPLMYDEQKQRKADIEKLLNKQS